MILILKWSVVLASVAIAGAAVCLGTPTVSPGPAIEILLDPDHPLHVVLWEARVPRVVLGVLAGAALGVSGLLLQDVLGNPIAGPELLGVSSGAAVVTVVIVVLGLGVPVAALPYAALAGALAAGALVLLAIGRTRSPDHVALVGAAVSAACGGLVVAAVGLGTQGNVVVLFRYLLGSLSARGWSHVDAVAPWLLIGIGLAALLRRRVGVLTLGDDVAAGLGLPVVRTRVAALALAAVLAAAVASVCGPVAFVALLAPHLARRLVGSVATHRVFWAVPPVGAALLVLADLVSRTIFYPVEVPVGVATTVVGVPALVLVLRTRPQLQGSLR